MASNKTIIHPLFTRLRPRRTRYLPWPNERIQLGRDIDKRKRSPVPRRRARHQRVREPLLHHEYAPSDLHRRRHEPPTRRNVSRVRDAPQELGAAPLAAPLPLPPRPQHRDARAVLRDQQHRVPVPGRQVDGVAGADHVLRRGSSLRLRVRDGHGRRRALRGGHVEPVQRAAGRAAVARVGHQEGVLVRGREARVAQHRVVDGRGRVAGGGGGRGHVPLVDGAPVGGQAEERPRVRAEHVDVAAAVVLDVLGPAVPAAGHGGQVRGPEDAVRGRGPADYVVVA